MRVCIFIQYVHNLIGVSCSFGEVLHDSLNPPLRLHLCDVLDHVHLFLVRAVVLGNTTPALSELLAAATDLVPWQVEDGIHGLETLVGQLGQEEVDPSEANCSDAYKEEHRAAGGHGNEHGGDGLGVAVFCVDR